MQRLVISIAAALVAIGAVAHEGAGPAAPSAHAHAGDGHGHSDGGAIGVPGRAADVARTVDVDMSDAMRFTPARIAAKRGETIRFRITNSGRLKHEFVLGTARDLKAHDALMKRFPEMEHDEPNMVTVAPGEVGEVVWRFTRAGTVAFACLQPGHYDAGMTGTVTVAPVRGVSPARPARHGRADGAAQ